MNVVELEFDSIRIGTHFSQKPYNIVVLKDLDSDAYLAIWIGETETSRILSKLENSQLLFSKMAVGFSSFIILLKLLGVVAARVLITHMDKDIFRACVILLTGKEEDDLRFTMTGRFADAMILAMHFKTRFFANVEVMRSSAVLPETVVDVFSDEQVAPKEKELSRPSYPEGGFSFTVPDTKTPNEVILALVKYKLGF